jgi:hypothetical protein
MGCMCSVATPFVWYGVTHNDPQPDAGSVTVLLNDTCVAVQPEDCRVCCPNLMLSC